MASYDLKKLGLLERLVAGTFQNFPAAIAKALDGMTETEKEMALFILSNATQIKRRDIEENLKPYLKG